MDPLHPSPHGAVLLIGASRGLGLGLAQEYLARGSRVVATVRDERRTALDELADTADGRLEIEHVDITAPDQVDALGARLAARRFDLLFVNAGATTPRRRRSPRSPPMSSCV
jgi:NAD(P)-dependent dehydrogenase (short-subunit alcohol dehydrogenase family)